jgi:acyl-CoA hydrolase
MITSVLAEVLRPGDQVLIGQATAEPTELVQALFELAPRISGLEAFCGLSLNPAWSQNVPEALSVATYCGVGTLGPLVERGRARVMPCSLSQLTALLAARKLPADVVFLQVSPADAQGYHSPACAIDYAWDAVKTARAVVVEVNHSIPAIRCATRIHSSQVVVAAETHRPLPQQLESAPAEVHRQVAAQVVRLIPDGATVQLGIGGLAVAVAQALRHHRGLKLRSGMVGDWFLDLLAAGALNTDVPEACLASLAVGSQDLYDTLSPTGVLGFASPMQLVQGVPGSPFMAINSAIEVDLYGQVNAEFLGPRYVGTVGGQPDYFRAARRSSGGLAILALPATSGRSATSRIIPRLEGAYVTTAQSDVDCIVTENGIADLRGTDFDQRRRLIAGIADARVREALERGQLD